jgi:hypothetical protein
VFLIAWLISLTILLHTVIVLRFLKLRVSKCGSVSVIRFKEGKFPTDLVSLERATFNPWMNPVSKLMTKKDAVSEMRLKKLNTINNV